MTCVHLQDLSVLCRHMRVSVVGLLGLVLAVAGVFFKMMVTLERSLVPVLCYIFQLEAEAGSGAEAVAGGIEGSREAIFH